MDRRSFLLAGAAASALAATARSHAAPAAPTHFALGFHAGGDGGWIDAAHRGAAAAVPRVKLALLGVQPAAGAAPLRALEVELLYRVAAVAGGLAAYRWAHLARRGDAIVASKALVHEVDADQIAGVRVRYILAGGTESMRRETTFALSDAVTPLVATGHYALVGPSAASAAPPAWRHVAAPNAGACALARCDGRAPDFDAVLIAVQAA